MKSGSSWGSSLPTPPTHGDAKTGCMSVKPQTECPLGQERVCQGQHPLPPRQAQCLVHSGHLGKRSIGVDECLTRVPKVRISTYFAGTQFNPYLACHEINIMQCFF